MAGHPMATRLAANLRRARKHAGLSQKDVAVRAGIHRAQVSLYAPGDPLPRV